MFLRKISLILLGIIILSISSCTQKKKITGSEFIDRSTFVLIITDIYLIDGITNDMKYYRKYNPSDSIDLYTSIFEKYQVSKDDYIRTLEEYSKYPELLDEVYSDVLVELNIKMEGLELEKDEMDPFDKPPPPGNSKNNRRTGKQPG